MYSSKNTDNFSKSIARIDIREITVKNFRANFLLKNKPVLITNIFSFNKKLSLWSPKYLAEKLGNKVVRINTSKNGRFGIDPIKGGAPMPPIFMPFNEYIDKMNFSHQKLYLGQISIIRELPKLLEDIKIPIFINNKNPKINLWVGPGGNTSPLHYDGMNNFFIQLYGTKKIWLSSPKEFYNLYPNPWYSRAPHTSKVNIENIDLNIFPKASKVRFIEFTIKPGEMLFIPVYWWHQVLGEKVTVSVNMWWKAIIAQHLVPAALHNLLYNISMLFKKNQ